MLLVALVALACCALLDPILAEAAASVFVLIALALGLLGAALTLGSLGFALSALVDWCLRLHRRTAVPAPGPPVPGRSP